MVLSCPIPLSCPQSHVLSFIASYSVLSPVLSCPLFHVLACPLSCLECSLSCALSCAPSCPLSVLSPLRRRSRGQTGSCTGSTGPMGRTDLTDCIVPVSLIISCRCTTGEAKSQPKPEKRTIHIFQASTRTCFYGQVCLM